MLSEDFRKGFRHELANRSFALISTRGLARRYEGRPEGLLWASYVELELFNVPRYREAAHRWHLLFEPGAWTRLRGTAVAAAPRLLARPMLELALPATMAYVAELRRLRDLAPAGGEAFLEYVVHQEEVQVEMMRLALDRRFDEIPGVVDEFLDSHRDVPLF